jgi:hypothetical protein
MAEEKQGQPVQAVKPKMIRVFSRHYKVKVILTPDDRREGKRVSGYKLHIRQCEGFMDEKYLPKLLSNKRYGTDYLTQPDFFKLYESDQAAADSWIELMRKVCAEHEKSPPQIRMKAVLV